MLGFEFDAVYPPLFLVKVRRQAHQTGDGEADGDDCVCQGRCRRRRKEGGGDAGGLVCSGGERERATFALTEEHVSITLCVWCPGGSRVL